VNTEEIAFLAMQNQLKSPESEKKKGFLGDFLNKNVLKYTGKVVDLYKVCIVSFLYLKNSEILIII